MGGVSIAAAIVLGGSHAAGQSAALETSPPGRIMVVNANVKAAFGDQVGDSAPRMELFVDKLLADIRDRRTLPVGPLFCVINGLTLGAPWSASAARAQLRRVAARAGVRRRFAPHQLRHAHAVEMAREGVPLNLVQRQLGHSDLRVTSIYLEGIDSGEVIETVRRRRAPMMPASAGLRL